MLSAQSIEPACGRRRHLEDFGFDVAGNGIIKDKAIQ